MSYGDMNFKIPIEDAAYKIENENNKIILNTNLRFGLPMENINKIAGPVIEAWHLKFSMISKMS
ncbi:MAG: hypothetical protein FWE34_06895 [Defluviitaleaceae bacterium]|nr:hypothetical protein [Defluviitaleaceae bacterium]